VADNNTVARPYAEAAFEVARENNTLDELSASLQAAGELLSDGQVVRFLGQPSLNDDQRLEFLQGLFAKAVGEGSVFAGGSQHGTNLLKLLLENGRVVALPEISAQFEALKSRVENSIDAVITAASPLSEAQEQAIASSLSEKLGREVRISTQIDENLIGGAVIRAGDVVIDGSLRARLEGLANALTK
jgi:F-type H+-transporting ATPase subunit delta